MTDARTQGLDVLKQMLPGLFPDEVNSLRDGGLNVFPECNVILPGSYAVPEFQKPRHPGPLAAEVAKHVGCLRDEHISRRQSRKREAMQRGNPWALQQAGYRVVNHRARELQEHRYLGSTNAGTPVYIDERFLAAE